MQENDKQVDGALEGVVGPCGKTYVFKPRFCGIDVRCPNCRKVFRVPMKRTKETSNLLRYISKQEGQIAEIAEPSEKPVWARSYEVDQVFMTADESYEIREQGKTELIVAAARARRFHNVAIDLVLVALAFAIAALARTRILPYEPTAAVAIFVGGIVVSAIVFRFKFFKRPVVFWESPDRAREAFHIVDVNRLEFPRAHFQVVAPDGTLIGTLAKPWMGDILRGNWSVLDSDGRLAFVAQEDSLVLAFLRRLFFTKLWWLRTNFVFLDPTSEDTLGELTRRWTIRDRYLLDLSENNIEMDVRLLWSLAILLDTVERR